MANPYTGYMPQPIPGPVQPSWVTSMPGNRPASFGNSLSRASTITPLGAKPSFGVSMFGAPKASSVTYLNAAERAMMQQDRMAAMIEAMNAANGSGANGMPTAGGAPMGAPAGSKWANVNKWDAQIQQAIARVAQEFGVTVPGNVVKAVMQLESGGAMVGCNTSGYCGLMQTGPGSNVRGYNHAYNMTPEGNLYYGVQELANWYKVTGSWDTAPLAYFSGYNYNKPWVTDSNGTSVGAYDQIIKRNMAELNAAGGSGGMAGAGTGGTGWNGITGGRGMPISQEYGLTSWALGGGRSMYGYTTAFTPGGAYGGHIGLDVGIPAGTPLYSPVSGRVVQSGGSGYYCNYSACGNGVGELKIKLSNGDEIILGHMSRIGVPVGAIVQPGQLVGSSGGYNGDHVHVEYRKYTPGATTSGYTAIDPRIALGGALPTTAGGATQSRTGWTLPNLSGIGQSAGSGGLGSSYQMLQSQGFIR